MSDKTIPVVLKRRPNCTMCGQPYDATGRLLALETERDQFAASCDVFRGRIQALELERAGAVDALLVVTAERDAARAEGARLKEALKAARRQMQNEWHNKPRIGMEVECATADAALSGSPSTAEWLAQHDAEVRQAVLMEYNFGAFTTLRERVKVLEGVLRSVDANCDHTDDCDRSREWATDATECSCCMRDVEAALSPTTDGAPKPKKSPALDPPTLTKEDIKEALEKGRRAAEAVHKAMDKGGYRP